MYHMHKSTALYPPLLKPETINYALYWHEFSSINKAL